MEFLMSDRQMKIIEAAGKIITPSGVSGLTTNESGPGNEYIKLIIL